MFSFQTPGPAQLIQVMFWPCIKKSKSICGAINSQMEPSSKMQKKGKTKSLLRESLKFQNLTFAMNKMKKMALKCAGI